MEDEPASKAAVELRQAIKPSQAVETTTESAAFFVDLNDVKPQVSKVHSNLNVNNGKATKKQTRKGHQPAQ